MESKDGPLDHRTPRGGSIGTTVSDLSAMPGLPNVPNYDYAAFNRNADSILGRQHAVDDHTLHPSGHSGSNAGCSQCCFIVKASLRACNTCISDTAKGGDCGRNQSLMKQTSMIDKLLHLLDSRISPGVSRMNAALLGHGLEQRQSRQSIALENYG
jgi:hypothetical protein